MEYIKNGMEDIKNGIKATTIFLGVIEMYVLCVCINKVPSDPIP